MLLREHPEYQSLRGLKTGHSHSIFSTFGDIEPLPYWIQCERRLESGGKHHRIHAQVLSLHFRQLLEQAVPGLPQRFLKLKHDKGSAPQQRQFFGMLIEHNMMAMHKKAYEGVLGINGRSCLPADFFKFLIRI